MRTQFSEPKPLSPEGHDRRDEPQSIEFSPFSWRLTMRAPAWTPPTDLFETETHVVVRVEVAGMKEDDFNIEINGRQLTIRGLRQDHSERRAYHQMEISFGEFVIDLEIPQHVEINRVEAIYENGFLRISLPKARPRTIAINE